MIREKYLVPGRVLGRWSDHPRYPQPEGRDANGDPIGVWVPCMVVSYLPHFGETRRHARSQIDVYGWNVLVLWMDDRRVRLESVWVASDHAGWKLLW